MRKFIQTFLFLVVSILGQGWILPGSDQLTSSFGEYRVGHFHAGMDLRTPAGIGSKITAPWDGDIMRVTASPWGYGLALYLRGSDDKITVYAHLSRFTETVMARVRQEQYRNEKYPVDIWFQVGEIPVSKGDVIGYSGDTGAGSPHLHFETRRGMGKYINPFLAGYLVEDNVSPKFQGLYITPESDDAVIEGYSSALSYQAFETIEGGSGYYIRDTVDVYGSVGISVRAFDWQSAGNPNRMGIYELMLLTGDDIQYYAKYDSFLFDDTRQVGHAFDLFSEGWGGDRYHRLFRREFLSAHPFRMTEEGGGIITPEPGEVIPVRIVARDFFGNFSDLNLVIRGNAKPTLAGFRLSIYDWGAAIVHPAWVDENQIEMVISTDNGQSWRFTEERREKDYISFRAKPGDLIRMAYSQPEGIKRRYYFSIPPTSPFDMEKAPVDIDYRVDETHAYIQFRSDIPLGYPESIVVTPEAPFDIDTPDERTVLLRLPLSDMQPSSWNATLNFCDGRTKTATFQTFDIDGKGGEYSFDDLMIRFPKGGIFPEKVRMIFVRDTTVYQLHPSSMVMPKLFRIWLPGQGEDGEYIARLWAEKLYHAGTDTSRAPKRPYISGLQRTGGSFTIARDTLAPKIDFVSLSRSRIAFTILDEGAGFGEEELPDTYIDGVWVLNELDSDRDRCTVEIPDDLDVGEHELLIVARDRVGNTVEIRRTFQ